MCGILNIQCIVLIKTYSRIIFNIVFISCRAVEVDI